MATENYNAWFWGFMAVLILAFAFFIANIVFYNKVKRSSCTALERNQIVWMQAVNGVGLAVIIIIWLSYIAKVWPQINKAFYDASEETDSGDREMKTISKPKMVKEVRYVPKPKRDPYREIGI
jgi:hypothetical protein